MINKTRVFFLIQLVLSATVVLSSTAASAQDSKTFRFAKTRYLEVRADVTRESVIPYGSGSEGWQFFVTKPGSNSRENLCQIIISRHAPFLALAGKYELVPQVEVGLIKGIAEFPSLRFRSMSLVFTLKPSPDAFIQSIRCEIPLPATDLTKIDDMTIDDLLRAYGPPADAIGGLLEPVFKLVEETNLP